MKYVTSTVRSHIVALVALGVLGCGGEDGGETVTGNVSYRGQPIEHGAVTFFPAAGRPVNAAIAAGGEYLLELPPGDYDVVVNVSFDKPPGWKEGDPLPKQKIVLPDHYTSRVKSKLKATIVPGQEEPINFELK